MEKVLHRKGLIGADYDIFEKTLSYHIEIYENKTW